MTETPLSAPLDGSVIYETNLICTAGRATRLGSLAPDGCKVLTEVAGKPVIEHQLEVLGSATIICRPEHADALRKYGPVVTGEWAGVGQSIAEALHAPHVDGSVLVVYGDTLFTELPEGSDWIGTSRGEGGRAWDVVYEDGTVSYDHVPEGASAEVCVGLYAFSNLQRLRRIMDQIDGWYGFGRRSWGMAPVINRYRSLAFVDIPSWADVGTGEAVAAYERSAA